MSYNRNYRRGQRRSRRIPTAYIPIIIIAVGIIAAAGFLIINLFFGQGSNGLGRPQPNMEEVHFFDYYDNSHLAPGRMYAVINGEIITAHAAPTFIDGRLYLPADFLRAHVDRYIFWEQGSNRLTITTIDEVKRFRPNEDTYTVNWQSRPLVHPIREIAGMAYMSADMVMERYPVTIKHQEEYNFVILNFHRYQRLIYNVVEAVPEENEPQNETNEDFFVPLRFGASDQYPIMARLHPGDNVVNLGAVPREENEDDEENYDIFYRVQAENGLTGYVLAENLAFGHVIAAIPQVEERRPVTRAANEPVNLAWHLIDVGNPAAWYVPQGVNVLSPWWFTFDDIALNGDIISLANHAYVNWAHSNGMAVWPMLQDADRTGRFDPAISRAVLEDAYVRDHVIRQLMNFIEYFNLDGIQVDYEVVPPDIADQWIQFLRELAVPMRQAGAVLSVAAKVPMPHNMFWNRTEIGLTVDYIIIMAYDEYWQTSPVAGPVASFDFVLNGVRNTLNEVPNYQIIVALPTYVRIWREEFVDGEWQLVFNLRGETPRQVGMAYARVIVTSRGGEFAWDYITRQYYAEVEFIENNIEVRYRVWLEDLRSMNEKLTVFTRYDLAGVAFWQKGLELPAMWEMVYGHLN